jgi:two-component system phosphate regulon sensor histidine kinase PhoR
MADSSLWRLLRGVLAGSGVALVLLLFMSLNLFQQVQLTTTRLYYVPSDASGNLVLVALDDASLQRYGRSPAEWSREIYADLTGWLNAAGARVVAFDLLFSEEAEGDAAFMEALLSARTSENALRSVMAVAGVRAPVRAAPGEYENAIQYADALLPVDLLYNTVDNIGFVNTQPDVDGLVRRQPSIINVNNEYGLSFSLATYLAWLRIPTVAIPQVLTQADNALQVTSERRLPVDERGFWLQNYFGPPAGETRETFPVLSLVDVLDGNVSQDLFTDKIVMVGLMNHSGAVDRFSDQYPVPSAQFGAEMAGVEIQAHAVETLIQDVPLVMLSQPAQMLLIGLLAVGSSLLYVFPRWSYKLVLLLLLLIGLLVGAFVLFNTQQIMMPLFYPLLALLLPCLLIIGLDISREQRLRQRADFLLQSLVAVSEQRLQIDAIVPLIAADVRGILPQSRGLILVQDAPGRDDTSLEPVHRWPPELEPDTYQALIAQVVNRQTPLVRQNRAALPVVWQGHVTGVLVLESEHLTRHLPLLNDFVSRLAPALDNAFLYQDVVRQRGMLSSVLTYSPSAIFVLDDYYQIQLQNEAARTLFQVEPGQTAIEAMQSLTIHDDDRAEIDRLFRQREAFRYEVKIGDATYSMQAASVPDIQRWVVLLTDISYLIELSDLKTRMLRMASHDLKNPLSRIMGYGQLLEMDETLSETTEKYLGYIMRSADEMNRLIADLLDVERLRSGRVNKELFSFKEMVLSLVRRHEPDVTRNQQTMTTDISDAVMMLRGDMRQLSQAVSNLISNAIKYTPEGGEIDVRLHFSEPNLLRFEVEDNGIGIPQEAQEKLFTDFYRVQTRETAGISGTGLGLSLVKSVVQAHGGRVGVESEPGQGSRFYFELPVDAMTDEDTSAHVTG